MARMQYFDKLLLSTLDLVGASVRYLALVGLAVYGHIHRLALANAGTHRSVTSTALHATCTQEWCIAWHW